MSNTPDTRYRDDQLGQCLTLLTQVIETINLDNVFIFTSQSWHTLYRPSTCWTMSSHSQHTPDTRYTIETINLDNVFIFPAHSWHTLPRRSTWTMSNTPDTIYRDHQLVGQCLDIHSNLLTQVTDHRFGQCLHIHSTVIDTINLGNVFISTAHSWHKL